MLQRIQSVYLFLAAVLNAVCLSMPIAEIYSKGFLSSTLYNLWLVKGDGSHEFSVTTVYFGILVLAICITLATIFLYRKRRLQMKMCLVTVVVLLTYIVPLAVTVGQQYPDVKPTYFAAFPVVALIFCLLAYMGIRKDDKLVRSADRLR